MTSDKATRKLNKELTQLMTKSIVSILTPEEEARANQLNAYFATVNEIEEKLGELSERDLDIEKQQCYNVYEY